MYDLISTSKKHIEVLYDLFKKETVLNNISTTIFSQKIQSIKDYDTNSFFRFEKLRKELIAECLALFITPMIHELEIKRAMVDLGSVFKVYSQKFLQQLEINDVTIPLDLPPK